MSEDLGQLGLGPRESIDECAERATARVGVLEGALSTIGRLVSVPVVIAMSRSPSSATLGSK
jgi:hypothetical protein